MKKILLLLVLAVTISVSVRAESPVVGTYHTKESIEKTYLATLQAASLHFDIASSNQAQGTIQANKRSWSHEVYGKLFIIVSKDADGVSIVATFKRVAVLKKGPLTGWATDFGDELKKTLPDLTCEVTKQ